MGDQDLGITGKDVSWEALVDGEALNIVGSVASFNARPRFDTNERKHLGTNDIDIDKIPIGWEGDFEVTAKERQIEDAFDLYIRRRTDRVPIDVVVHETVRYRNGTVAEHTYRQLAWEYETTGTRGESVVHRITWMTGIANRTSV